MTHLVCKHSPTAAVLECLNRVASAAAASSPSDIGPYSEVQGITEHGQGLSYTLSLSLPGQGCPVRVMPIMAQMSEFTSIQHVNGLSMG
jgi:hypothetical protein